MVSVRQCSRNVGCVIPLEKQRECPKRGQSVGCSSWLGQLRDAVAEEVKLQKWSLQASNGVIFKMALQAAVTTNDTIQGGHWSTRLSRFFVLCTVSTYQSEFFFFYFVRFLNLTNAPGYCPKIVHCANFFLISLLPSKYFKGFFLFLISELKQGCERKVFHATEVGVFPLKSKNI